MPLPVTCCWEADPCTIRPLLLFFLVQSSSPWDYSSLWKIVVLNFHEYRGRIQRKHGLWDPMPQLTITSLYVHSRVDSHTFTMGNPMPESTLTLCQSRRYSPSQGLWIWHLNSRSETIWKKNLVHLLSVQLTHNSGWIIQIVTIE
jgi:hypothetical protein